MEESNVPVSRVWLEGLSTGELIKLADSFGIDIPSELERIFIIEELLECYNSGNNDVKEDLEINPSYSETAALPKQYNISYIEVIIRDPLWVFVFWEIKKHDREIHENAGNFNGYYLRLVPLGDTDKENSFTVPVNIEDGARYIGLAAPYARETSLQDAGSSAASAGNSAEDSGSSPASGRYVIILGVIRGSSELQVVASEPFCLPKLIENYNINSMKENPLVRLSAVEDLSITKSTDRQSKIKRQ